MSGNTELKKQRSINVNDKTKEIESINAELTKQRIHIKKLVTQKQKIELEILQFITDQNQQGLKNKTSLFLKEEKEVLKSKTRSEKEQILSSFFSKCPLDDPLQKAKEFLSQKTPENCETLLRTFFHYLDDKEEKIIELLEKLKPERVVRKRLLIKKLT